MVQEWHEQEVHVVVENLIAHLPDLVVMELHIFQQFVQFGFHEVNGRLMEVRPEGDVVFDAELLSLLEQLQNVCVYIGESGQHLALAATRQVEMSGVSSDRLQSALVSASGRVLSELSVCQHTGLNSSLILSIAPKASLTLSLLKNLITFW